MEVGRIPCCPPFAGIIRIRFLGYDLSPKYFRHPHCKTIGAKVKGIFELGKPAAKIADFSNYSLVPGIFLSSLVLVSAEAIKPVGTAITPRPIKSMTEVKILPPTVIG